jgi:predicted Zn-dependent protease
MAVITPTALEISVEGKPSLRWALEDIRQTQGFSRGEHVRFERGSLQPEALVVPDQQFLVSLRALAPAAARRFHHPGRQSTGVPLALVGVCLAVVAFGLVVYQWGVPAFTTVLASAIPARWEERLGDLVLEELAPKNTLCTDEGAVNAVERITAALLSVTPDFPYTSTVFVVRSEEFNAVALPGARILIYSDLLGKAGTPEELAAVLAHELQHAQLRHPMQATVRGLSTSALITLVAGGDGAVRGVLTAASTLDQLRYGRNQEEAADTEAVRLLQRARIDSQGMLRFLARAQQEESQAGTAVPRYLSSHPPTADRIERLRGVVEAQGYAPVALDGAADWERVRTSCLARNR